MTGNIGLLTPTVEKLTPCLVKRSSQVKARKLAA